MDLLDRSEWAKGPWDDEPEDGAYWLHSVTGARCVAIRNFLGVWCGYVQVPEALIGVEYSDDCFDTVYIHGGLTFSGRLSHCGYDELFFVGFDCGHFDDRSPHKKAQDKGGHYRSLVYVKGQCFGLGLQLQRIGKEKASS